MIDKQARETYERYQYAIDRGHRTYQKEAKRNEQFYLGAGRQWEDRDKAQLEEDGKPWLEENIIFSTVNAVLGVQTQSRMDISYKPREPADQDSSDLLTKIAMFVLDKTKFPWKESEVFADGMIQQRGYFDVRMNFDENVQGDVDVSVLDPLDVVPDPDSKSYDPDDWADVITTSWVRLEDVKELYGVAKFKEVAKEATDNTSDELDEQRRNSFGDDNLRGSYHQASSGDLHIRLFERQYWKLQNRSFFFDPGTGELSPAPDGLSTSKINKMAKGLGKEIIKKLTKRVRWSVSTKETMLHESWSPYDHFTIIPFFPYFRRGQTVGIVDNLIKTQEMLNKTFSQILHIVNTTANSGWIVEESSLVNMDVEDLEENGAQTGLVIEHKAGRSAPEKIQPNQIPTGLKDLTTTGVELIRLISGVSETFQGGKSNEVSGVAIQSKVQQTATQLAVPIDNLFRTRNLLASRLLKLLQQFFTNERTFLIVNNEDEGTATEPAKPQPVSINQEDEEGNILNDITVGKYDVVITDVPTQVSFENAQFAQAIEMRKFGIQIPDDELILMSTLSRKTEIAKRVSGEGTEEQQAQAKQTAELQVAELQAKVAKLNADATKSSGSNLDSLSKVAVLLKDNPGLLPLIEALIEQEKPDEQLENAPNQIEEGDQSQQVGDSDVGGTF